MKIKFLILIIYCAICVSGEEVSIDKVKREVPWRNPNHILFQSIPEKDQDDFIVLHLALGLNERAYAAPFDPVNNFMRSDPVVEPLDIPQDINLSQESYYHLKAIATPKDFSTELLDWTEDMFELTDDEIHEMVVKSAICPSTRYQCITPGDVGGHCCPF